jgi:hypothetical protein
VQPSLRLVWVLPRDPPEGLSQARPYEKVLLKVELGEGRLPIPPEHLERLEADLSAHESWLGTLRLQIGALEAEASAHEIILRLGRDPDLRSVLQELHDRPDLAERVGNDPRSFLEERGIEVPDGATVALTSEERSALEARFRNDFLDFGVGWSPVNGFYLIETPERPEPPPPESASREED